MSYGTLTNTILDPAGAALGEAVTVTARLKPGTGFRVDTGTEVTAVLTTTSSASTGAWTLLLEQNANIQPSGTWWEITEQIPDADGGTRVWAVEVGSGTQTVQAAQVTPSDSTGLASYLTQDAADARYARIGTVTAAMPYFNITDAAYGAVAGNADNGPAVNLAIAAARAAGGGTVLVPVGKFDYTTQILLDDCSNINFLGVAENGNNGLFSSCLNYTGGTGGVTVTDGTTAASSSHITSPSLNLTSAHLGCVVEVVLGQAGDAMHDNFWSHIRAVDGDGHGFTCSGSPTATIAGTATVAISDSPGIRVTNSSWNAFEHMVLRCSNAVFNGPIVSYHSTPTHATSPSQQLFRRCDITGTSTAKLSNEMLQATGVLHLNVDGCLFTWGVDAIKCTVDYMRIRNTKFGSGSALLSGYPVIGCGQGAVIENCQIDPQADGTAKFFDCPVASNTRTLTLRSISFADTTDATSGNWVNFNGRLLTLQGPGSVSTCLNMIRMVGDGSAPNNLLVTGAYVNRPIDFASGAIGGVATFIGCEIAASTTFLHTTNLAKLVIIGCHIAHANLAGIVCPIVIIGGGTGLVDQFPLFLKAGAVADGDFDLPVSGLMGLDTTNSRLYCRVGSTWKYAALT